MKPSLILLCAGRGKRMEALTDDQPKALVAVHNRPIVEQTTESFLSVWPDSPLFLLSGYKCEKISQWIDSQIYVATMIYNEFWNSHGPIISCNSGLKGSGTPPQVFLGNGDTLFNAEVFQSIAKNNINEGFYLVGSRVHDQSSDDMLIHLEDNKVLNAEKRKSGNIKSDYESAGLLIASGPRFVSVLKQVFGRMSADLMNDPSLDGPWHGIVQELVKEGHTISFINVPEKSWWEFDTQQCIAKAEAAAKC